MKINKVLLFLLVLLFSSAFLAAADLNLQSLTIYYANDDAILEMAKARGFDTSLSITDLRNALYEYHEIEVYTETIEEKEESNQTITLLNADNVYTYEDESIDLRGNVELRIDDSSTARFLIAERIIYNKNDKSVTAIGRVSIKEEDSSGTITNELESDIATISLNADTILLSNAATNFEMEDNALLSYGDTITTDLTVNTTFLENAIIASSVKDPHSSLRAKEFILLPENDLLATHTFLYVGRVPVLYLPVFFNPSTRMFGNPVFGISSDRGMFLNTTFEIFGTYPKNDEEDDDESSLLDLATFGSSGEDLGGYSNGIYYSSKVERSELEAWAEDNKSYLAILGDAYEKDGIHLGLDTDLSFFEAALKINSKTGLSVSPLVNNRNLRYYSNSKITFNKFGLTSTLSLPIYSDPLSFEGYKSRHTNFSLIGGFLEQEFKDGTATNTYKIDFNTTYSLPSKYRQTWLSKFEIRNVNLFAEYKWDSAEFIYENTKINLPSFSFTAEGAIFDYKAEKKDSVKEEVAEEKNESYLDTLVPTVFPSLYTETIKEKVSKKLSTDISFSLKYQIKNTLSNVITIKEVENTNDFSNSLSTPITLNFASGNIITFDNTFTPSLLNTYKEDKNDLKTEKLSLLNNTVIKSPYIGLTYKISTRFYEESSSLDNLTSTTEYKNFTWDKDSIKTHSLDWAYTFGMFTPSVNYILPPLEEKISPKLTFKLYDFTLASSLVWTKKDLAFELSSFNVSASYNDTYFSTSLSSTLRTNTTSLTPLTSSAVLNLHTEKKNFLVSSKLTMSNDMNFNTFADISLLNELKIPYLNIKYSLRGKNFEEFKNEYVNFTLVTDDLSFDFWHKRIKLDFNTKATINVDFLEEYSSSFALTFGFKFKIEEFLDIRFDVKSVNHGFYKYLNKDEPFFKLMIDDLFKSFDFFGDGRTQTQFVLDSMSLSLTHYMRDWDLSCKYDSRVVLSNKQYSFKNSFTILVKWKLFSELEAKQDWENSGSGWKLI